MCSTVCWGYSELEMMPRGRDVGNNDTSHAGGSVSGIGDRNNANIRQQNRLPTSSVRMGKCRWYVSHMLSKEWEGGAEWMAVPHSASIFWLQQAAAAQKCMSVSTGPSGKCPLSNPPEPKSTVGMRRKDCLRHIRGQRPLCNGSSNHERVPE